jgi:hypothetical protein
MRDDLQMLRDKSTELEIKLDREVNELKATVEKAKNDVIKSVIAIMGTFSAIAFTISRFIQISSGGGTQAGWIWGLRLGAHETHHLTAAASAWPLAFVFFSAVCVFVRRALHRRPPAPPPF